MKKVKQFFLNIGKHIWVYILFCVGCSLLSVYVVDLVDKPRNEETISILVASYDSECQEFKEKVNARKPKYLREIQYNTYSVLDSNFERYYSSLAYGLCDIVILPESQINVSKALDYYAIFDDEIKNQYFPDKEFYSVEDNDYGVLIHKKGEENKLLTYYLSNEDDENYYLFFYYPSWFTNSF